MMITAFMDCDRVTEVLERIFIKKAGNSKGDMEESTEATRRDRRGGNKVSWIDKQYTQYVRKWNSQNVYTPVNIHKYNVQKTIVDGIVFDSKLEAEYYCLLKLLKLVNEVKDFELKPRFELQPAFEKNGVKYQPIIYTADFKVIYADGRVEIVDTKGYETPELQLKRKMFEYMYPNMRLKVVKKG